MGAAAAPREGPYSARLLWRAIMDFEDETPRDRARRLRAESTAEELTLWRRLRAKRFVGFKFRREHRIGPYFADFCCIARHLVIELDGGQHAEEEKERKDSLRTAFLEEYGYRVMRFWNNQMNTELQGVCRRYMPH
jgi:very-short-patch-repair endonuclease